MIFGSGSVGGGVIGAGIVFTLQDQFSSTADKIKSKWKDLEGVTEKATMNMQSSMNKMKLGFMGLAVSAALIAPLAFGVSTAIKLEDQMADVRKTTGLTADEAERFKDSLFALDSRSGINDLIDIAKIGGSLGVATNELEGFTKAVDMANVALGDEFSGGAEEVTRALGTIKDLFKETKDMQYGEAMTKIGSALNELGAIGKATGDNVANFTNRMGQLGVIAPSLNETLALGATLQEVGVNGEIAAGGLSALLTEATELSKMHDRMAEFAAQMNMTRESAESLFNTSRGDFILQFAKSFQGMKAADVGRTLKQLGIGGTEAQKVIGSLAGSTELYADRLGVVNEQLRIGDSLQKEFNVKNNTTGALVDKAKKKFVELADALGKGLIPVLVPLVGLFMSLVDITVMFVKTPIGKFVIALTVAVAGLVAVVSAYVIVSNFARMASARLAIAFASMGRAAIAATFANQGLIAGIRALTASMMANPYLLAAAAAVLALAAAYTILKTSVSEFKGIMDGSREPVDGMRGAFQKLGAIIYTTNELFRSAGNDGFSMSKKTADALKKMGLYEFMVNLGTWIVRVKALFGGVAEGIKSVGSTVMTVVNFIVDGLNMLADAFGLPNLARNTSDIKRWIQVGKVFGYVVGVLMAGALFALAAAWLVAMAPIILGLAPFIAVVATFIYWGEIVDWVTGRIQVLGTAMGTLIEDIGNWISGAYDSFVGWGTSLVEGIWQGITNSWAWLKNGFLQLIRDLPGGGMVLDLFGVSEPTEPEGSPGGVSMPVPIPSGPETSELMSSVGTMNAQRAALGRTTQTVTKERVIEKTNSVKIELDGREVGSWLDERNETKDNRE